MNRLMKSRSMDDEIPSAYSATDANKKDKVKQKKKKRIVGVTNFWLDFTHVRVLLIWLSGGIY